MKFLWTLDDFQLQLLSCNAEQASKCYSQYFDGTLWPPTYRNVTITGRRTESCINYYKCDKINDCRNQEGLQMHLSGYVQRTCLPVNDQAKWDTVDPCNCHSQVLNDVVSRMDSPFAYDYTLYYLGVLSSFIRHHFNDVADFNIPIKGFELLYQSRLNQTETSNKNFTIFSCCLAYGGIKMVRHMVANKHCPVPETSMDRLKNTVHTLLAALVGKAHTEISQDPNYKIDENNLHIEDIIHGITIALTGQKEPCPLIGSTVPPANRTSILIFNNPIPFTFSDLGGAGYQEQNGSNNTLTGSGADREALRLLGLITSCVSLLCIALTLVAYAVLHLPPSKKWMIHTNLVIAIALTNIMVVFIMPYVPAESDSPLCIAKAIMLQYVATACFTWMLVEGIHMYRLLITVFTQDSRLWTLFYFGLGWLLPAVPVALTPIISPHAYNNSDIAIGSGFCWLRSDHIWYFLGPAAGVVGVNIFILAVVLHAIHKRLSTRMTYAKKGESEIMDKTKTLRQDLWRAMSLMPLLGLTWVLIFVRFVNVAAIDYIFTALIGLQGFFFFVFHCLLDRQVIATYYKRSASRSSTRSGKSNKSTSLHMSLFSRSRHSTSGSQIILPNAMSTDSFSDRSKKQTWLFPDYGSKNMNLCMTTGKIIQDSVTDLIQEK
ncbi:uncharacterized protein TRIADDRAFT_55875 [Trichoplax adhaerens]|uniref:G-protein coupled receptors family 2 profile 2 domain-containing protein n=1 Tax=Trichoplax adhaerens TaxID=10228 RepID=B3RW40_TRIAD|nr:hypothetical protein TRIADDRAFT_55875 [Trichoplax adhaerens]EDV26110.1 hypothetical protein TRIADDRAFT_55875 [Trichoplax adhaerens]|eukprot:XP_002112143.1 hypothetical protein TRIADDRAFT_55875 [Trichoplax adhaerens]